MNLNSVNLIGRVTKQPERKTTQGGTEVCTFGLATNNVYMKNGQKIEETDFHNITAFGKTAETIGQYVVKGQELYVGGRVKYSSWDKQDGTKGYRTDIIATNFQFGQKPKAQTSQEIINQGPPPAPPTDVAEGQNINVEDIPF